MPANHLGRSIFVAKAWPASDTAAAFAALTWVEADGLQILPQLGESHSFIESPGLKSGRTEGIKGPSSGNDSTMTFRDVAADQGQADIKEQGEHKEGRLSVKIVDGSGTDNAPATGDPVEYGRGIAHSYLPNQGSGDTERGFTCGFRQNGITVVSTHN